MSRRLLDVYGKQFESITKQEQLAHFLHGMNVIHINEFDSVTDFDPSNTVGVAECLELRDSILISNLTGINHIVNTSRDDFAFSLFSACVLLKQPKLFIEKPLSFFKVHLNIDLPQQEESHLSTFKLLSHDDKYTVMGNVSDELDKKRSTRSLADVVQVILDEMITNAFVHTKDRKATTKSLAGGNEYVEVFLIHNSRRLFIGCIDPGGQLNVNNLRKHLYKKSINQLLEVDTKRQTGGVGLTYLIENSAGLYTATNTNKKTLVATMFPLSGGANLLEKFPKNLHFCESNNETT